MEVEHKIISSIQRQKNRPRYNIYMNEEYAFAIHEDILVKFSLAKGMELDDGAMLDLLKAEERHRAEQYALRYLGYRARTASQLRDYLAKKGFESEDCEAVIESFQEKNYIDDEDYARRWVEERKRMRPRGRYLLKQELSQRGIAKDLIDTVVVSHVSDEDEQEMIVELIDKKWRNKTFPNLYEAKKKIIPYLQRKGFSMGPISAAVERRGPAFIEQNEGE
ncbi:hypothetical protein BEP19_07820 [Ammoniphilus oxalaticus]|uniref:Regulatory protein RecX n=1 Tax=Ammoniphilus oxalaticus TaxID=66863 RepID=A0A419SJZ0_9BACL|nr:RecX family transcriptional regulator [Ammoniphilus oxalaticus]RKD24297.1 hypothetical protein BEP19_07820 [Ammoniphilus oxalaticus]